MPRQNGEDGEEQELLSLLMTPRRPKGMKQEDGGRAKGSAKRAMCEKLEAQANIVSQPEFINLSQKNRKTRYGANKRLEPNERSATGPGPLLPMTNVMLPTCNG